MSVNKIQTVAGVMEYWDDHDHQTHYVLLDFLCDTIENVEIWDRFFSELEESGDISVKVIIERIK